MKLRDVSRIKRHLFFDNANPHAGPSAKNIRSLNLPDNYVIKSVGSTQHMPSGMFSLDEPEEVTAAYADVSFYSPETDAEYEGRIKREESHKKMREAQDHETYLRVKAKIELETKDGQA